jgi:hypothetical protein
VRCDVLTAAKGSPATNKLIAFRQVPGGLFEFTNFAWEILTRLLGHFGKEPERLVEAVAILGRSEVGYGDVAVMVKTLPTVPVAIVLWLGHDEFAPNGSILFDSTIPDYLSTEDISVLCERIVEELAHFGQNAG